MNEGSQGEGLMSVDSNSLNPDEKINLVNAVDADRQNQLTYWGGWRFKSSVYCEQCDGQHCVVAVYLTAFVYVRMRHT